MFDVARLRYEVDSSQTVKAEKNLDKMTKAARDAEAAQKGIGNASTKAGRDVQAANDNITRSTGRMAKGFSKMKLVALAAFAAIAVGALAAVRGLTAFISGTAEAEKVQAQLSAAIQSTGGAAGQSLNSLNAHAAALQRVTLYGDETTNQAQAMLLTFTKIQGETFPRATTATLDLATAMKTDLKSAAIQVGKALNDPVLGMTALSRSGIQFTDAQKEVVKQMVNTGNVAGAQSLILKELETQFGGSAAAARGTLGGALTALKNAFGDLFEVSGPGSEALRQSIENLVAAISRPKFVKAIQEIGAALMEAFASTINFVAEHGDAISKSFKASVLAVSIFKAEYELAADTIRITFTKLPAAIGGAVISAMNSMVLGVQQGLNKIILAANLTIADLNNSSINPIKIPYISQIDENPEAIKNSYSKAGENAAKAFSDAGTKFRQSMTSAEMNFRGDSLDMDAAFTGGGSLKSKVIPTLKDIGSQLGSLAPKATKAAKAVKSVFQSAVESLQGKTKDLQFEATLIGLPDAQVSKLRKEQELLNAALQDGKQLTPELRGTISGLAQEYSVAEQHVNGLKAANDNYLQAVETGKGVTKEFFSSFIGGIREGKSVWDSLKDSALGALESIANKLIDMAVNNLVENAFSGGQSGGGGLSGIFSSLFGGGGGGGASIMPGLFASGGYTGNGAVSAAAGIVHGQEFVNNASSTAKYRPHLEAMNQGNWQPPVMAQPVPVPVASNNNQSIKVVIGGDIRVTTDDDKFKGEVVELSAQVVRASTPSIVEQSTKSSINAYGKGGFDTAASGRFGQTPKANIR